VFTSEQIDLWHRSTVTKIGSRKHRTDPCHFRWPYSDTERRGAIYWSICSYRLTRHCHWESYLCPHRLTSNDQIFGTREEACFLMVEHSPTTLGSVPKFLGVGTQHYANMVWLVRATKFCKVATNERFDIRVIFTASVFPTVSLILWLPQF